jgi:hypothetical protein
MASTVRVTLATMPMIQNQLMRAVKPRSTQKQKAGDLPAVPCVPLFPPPYAAFFSSAGFFPSAVGSGRSISVTSAIGALSPLRMPLFRMRR